MLVAVTLHERVSDGGAITSANLPTGVRTVTTVSLSHYYGKLDDLRALEDHARRVLEIYHGRRVTIHAVEVTPSDHK